MADQQGRKIRPDFTPLEAEAVLSILIGTWAKFERRRGAGTAKAALSRAIVKLDGRIKES